MSEPEISFQVDPLIDFLYLLASPEPPLWAGAWAATLRKSLPPCPAELRPEGLGWKGIGDHADLVRADLRHANLERADLRGATLFRADLSETYLFKANFRDAFLRKANLSGAKRGFVLNALCLRNATMPDGPVHE